MAASIIQLCALFAAVQSAATASDQSNETDTGACVYSAWHEWSPCTAPCGTGASTRHRQLASAASNDTAACAAAQVQQRACNAHVCDADCLVSDWSPWSRCTCLSVDEADRIRWRSRHVLSGSVSEGTVCPELSEVQTCGHLCEPAECPLSDWSEWSSCSATCGPSFAARTRTAGNDTSSGIDEQLCGPVLESRQCPAEECPSSSSLCLHKADGLYANPSDEHCSQRYMSCVNQMETWQRCPKDLVYLDANKRCERRDELPECRATAAVVSRCAPSAAASGIPALLWLFCSRF